MLHTYYGYWEDWELRHKVDFNGSTKIIAVHPDVTELSIRADVYSAWIEWAALRDNNKYLPAMRYSGLDPIPGGSTGGTFFLSNGWKLVIDLNKVAVKGVLYSDDYDTAYWNVTGHPLYPAEVSALVDTTVVTQNIVTGDLSSVPAGVWAHTERTLSAPPQSLAQIAQAIWQYMIDAGYSAEQLMRLQASVTHGSAVGLENGQPEFMALSGEKMRVRATYENGVRTVTQRDAS